MKIKRTPVKFRYFLAFLVFLLTASAAFSQTPVTLPTPTGFVNDYAGVIDAGTKQQLETRLRDFKQKTNPSVEIAVTVVDTTGDRPIFDYSLQMAREWKIGSKELDNPSALLLVAISDRKYYTQISKDLEDELPDGLAGQIQRQYLVPEFKKGNYSKGIADTVDAYIKVIESKQSGIAVPVASPTPRAPVGVQQKSSGCGFFVCAIVALIIFVIIISNLGKRGKSARDNDRWGGGGFGGGGGSGSDIAGNVLAGVAGAIIGNMLGGGGSSSGSSSSSDWGGSSGGGSDWGGFGGGGDFGGGGAGGDW